MKPERSSKTLHGSFLAALAFCLLAWTFASPPGAAPDEPGHMAYGWGLVTGQGNGLAEPGETFRVYSVADQVIPEPLCFAFKTDQSADCAWFLGERVGSTAHRYAPPLPLLTGAALRGATELGMDNGASVVARLVATAVSLSLVGASVVLHRRNSLVIAAIVLCLTPMTLFIGSAVNPNGPAVAGAIAAAAGFAALGFDHTTSRRSAWVLTLTGVFWMALSHPFSIVWAGMVAVLAAWLVTPWQRQQPNSKRAQPPGADKRWWIALTVLLGVGAAWFLYYLSGPAALGQAGRATGPANGLFAGPRETAQHWPTMISQITGVLGWNDTPLPWPTRLALLFAWLLAVGLIVNSTPRVDRRAIGAFVYGVLLVASAAMMYQEHFWQGRYVLPALCAALVLLAASSKAHDRWPLRLAQVAWVISSLGALWVSLRFTHGLGPIALGLDWPDFSDPDGWTPIISNVGVAALSVTAAVLGASSLHRLADPPTTRTTATPSEPAKSPRSTVSS